MIKNKCDKQRGFTLIELVVVMAIISVLTGLATFNFQQARQRARDVQRKNDLKQISNALEVYKNDQRPQVYPATEELDDLVTGGYLKAIPVDPRYETDSGSWEDYEYLLDPDEMGTNLEYRLTACLENRSDLEKVTDENCGPGDTGVVYELITP